MNMRVENTSEISYGYVGKIARINLTDSTVEMISTSNYAPFWLGGRAIGSKIFWDEVKPSVGAFDPENKMILMTGPTTGTGVPTGGRTSMVGISPNSLPEQFCWGNIGGWFGANLKFAGFDGIILEGRAPKPTHVHISDNEITFHSAENLWGMLVHETQYELEKIFDDDEITSLVIGPAGENLIRIASITSSNDNAFAKSGFGAVWGSKNLKAVSVKGTGTVTAYDPEKIFELRRKMGNPQRRLNPVQYKDQVTFRPHITFDVENQKVKESRLTCSYGCNQRCNLFTLDTKSGISDDIRTNQVHKCVSIYAFKLMNDSGWNPGMSFHTAQNNVAACLWMAGTPPPQDTTDPYLDMLNDRRIGNTMNFWDGDYDRGNVVNDLCTQYGMDKWDIIVWYMTWFYMGKQTGVLKDEDFGMEIDPSSEEFMKHVMHMITYREGKMGDLLAEGMARCIRTLGIEKYGNTIYKEIYSNVVPGLQLDIPISFESAWGHSFHWLGRGFQGINDITAWLPAALMLMSNTRDSQTNSHIHETLQYMIDAKSDPCHSPAVVNCAVMGEDKAELKESLTTCDWQCPNVFWMDMETEMLYAATGIQMSEEELALYAKRSKNLFRAILMRNYGRDREMEVKEVHRMLTYPDCEGTTVSWEDFNDLVDLYYDQRGWDRETGWPTLATWAKCGLSDIAEELKQLGKLPA
ncbi:MAG: aldehyde ferredoxin oxidoreductase [Clostridiales Family XIII bacterium]|jgi:aldehyde:ferredoxin oxidoreductase|nr:aldehyde ferredoxin oxidoreductase [Clostridiales Family XIII bacterium]